MLPWTVLFPWLTLSFHWIPVDATSRTKKCLPRPPDDIRWRLGIPVEWRACFLSHSPAIECRCSAGATRGGKRLSGFSATGWWGQEPPGSIRYEWLTATSEGEGTPGLLVQAELCLLQVMKGCPAPISLPPMDMDPWWASPFPVFGQREPAFFILFYFSLFYYAYQLFQVQTSWVPILRYMKEKQKSRELTSPASLPSFLFSKSFYGGMLNYFHSIYLYLKERNW